MKALLLSAIALSFLAFTQAPTGSRPMFQKPELVEIQGTVKELADKPCTHRVCREPTVTFIEFTDKDGKDLSLRAGPASRVKDLLKDIKAGDALVIKAFHPSRAPEGTWIIQSFSKDGNTVVFLDENMRPIWAGSRSQNMNTLDQDSEE